VEELPAALLERRFHGSLAAVTDSERRLLRPIGTTAYDVAVRTGNLLAELISVPGLRIFHGVRASVPSVPVIGHALSAGRRLLLVESVAWPPGWYTMTAAGRILCDGTYIGQSTRPLRDAVRQWRGALPRGHRVGAVVVVHSSADGTVALPVADPGGVSWVLAADALPDIRRRIGRGGRTASRDALAALLAATEPAGGATIPR
jgi:hypothetical protein